MLVAPAALLALSSLAAAVPLEQITFAQPASLSSIIPSLQLSACHGKQLQRHLDELTEPRLVQLEPSSEPIWITEGEKALLILKEGRRKFVDVTDEQEGFMMAQSKSTIPKSLSYSKKALKSLFDDLDTGAMKTFLTAFTGFRTRYYRSETGKESQRFLLKTVRDIASSSKLNITISEFVHPWGQNSIIARFEPSSHSKSEDIVILGGHQDSTNLLPFLPAPGADDDGSGTTSLLEAFKVLVSHGFVPSTNPVEFHWYSAEEGGLLGSQAVAQSYAKEGKSVRSMLQMDMTSFVRPNTKPTIGLIRDFVSDELAQLTALLATEYSDIGYTDTKCGYACSDHASWTKIGAPSIFTIESTFENSNHDIHSGRDTIQHEGFSFDHMAQFSRLVIAMAVELGGGASLGLKSALE